MEEKFLILLTTFEQYRNKGKGALQLIDLNLETLQSQNLEQRELPDNQNRGRRFNSSSKNNHT